MLISLLIPIMNRLKYLRQTLPTIIAAAKASPPCEIVVVDYSSTDGLPEYIAGIAEPIVYRRLEGKRYYHSTHARNLTVMAATGEYIIQLDTETIPSLEFLPYVRQRLAVEDLGWMCEGYLGRWIVVRREEFIAAGGYDERFTCYAPEDRDICLRLHRRGGKFETFPGRLLSAIPTSNAEKLANLDVEPYSHDGIWIKRSMHRKMKVILEQNIAEEVLVANEGGWGQWISV